MSLLNEIILVDTVAFVTVAAVAAAVFFPLVDMEERKKKRR